MKLKNVNHIESFLAAVEKCNGKVWLESPDGDLYNLKSKFSTYIALSALLSTNGEYLELFCSKREDVANFFEFFDEYPEINSLS